MNSPVLLFFIRLWRVSQIGFNYTMACGKAIFYIFCLYIQRDDHIFSAYPIAGVATLYSSVNCKESITRSISVKFRPVDAG